MDSIFDTGRIRFVVWNPDLDLADHHFHSIVPEHTSVGKSWSVFLYYWRSKSDLYCRSVYYFYFLLHQYVVVGYFSTSVPRIDVISCVLRVLLSVTRTAENRSIGTRWRLRLLPAPVFQIPKYTLSNTYSSHWMRIQSLGWEPPSTTVTGTPGASNHIRTWYYSNVGHTAGAQETSHTRTLLPSAW